MAASACSILKATKTFAQPFAREKQPKGWRREKKLNLMGTINPEFKRPFTVLGIEDDYSA
jgi:hypothetical protein